MNQTFARYKCEKAISFSVVFDRGGKVLSGAHDHQWKTEHDADLGKDVDKCVICGVERNPDLLDRYHRIRDEVTDYKG